MQHKGPTVFTDIVPVEGPACSSPTEKARLSASRVGVKGARKVDGTAFRARERIGSPSSSSSSIMDAPGRTSCPCSRCLMPRAAGLSRSIRRQSRRTRCGHRSSPASRAASRASTPRPLPAQAHGPFLARSCRPTAPATITAFRGTNRTGRFRLLLQRRLLQLRSTWAAAETEHAVFRLL
jgi:hypothetical protein